MLDAEDEADVSKIIANISKIKAEIEKLINELFVDNVDAFLTRSLGQFTAAEILELSPEKYAADYLDWDRISRHYQIMNNRMKVVRVRKRIYDDIARKKITKINYLLEENEAQPRPRKMLKIMELDNEKEQTGIFMLANITDVEAIDDQQFELRFETE